MAIEDVLLRLVVAATLTAVIGIDRELRAKPAGLRTNVVVGTATAAFAILGGEVISGGDPTRVASQVVSGIGFLGGGAIFAAGNKPSGLTTAAALWGSAAVGLAAGLAAYDVAGVLVVVLWLALWPLDRVGERLLHTRGRHEVRVQVIVDDLGAARAVQGCVATHGLRPVELTLTEVMGQPCVDLQLSGRADDVTQTLEALRDLDGAVLVVHGAVSRMED
jgi:uncharacterized membrane protein YhiD involved in acid resistance